MSNLREKISRLLSSGQNWGLFSKIFAALVAISIVPVIACSLLFYVISRQNVETEVSLSNLETLKQAQMAVDNTLEATERISQQIVRNKDVASFMNRPIVRPRSTNPAIADTINVADSFAEGVQYIDSISIYSFLNNMLVSSGTQRYAEMDGSFMDNYGNSLKTKGFTMWIEPDDTDVFGDKSRSLQFVEFIFETFNKPEGIVIIKLRNDEFAKLINDMYIRKSGYIFVLSDKGKVILGRNRLPDAFDSAAFMAKYKAAGDGYYKLDSGGQPLLISFTTSRYNQWKYVAVLPAGEVADKTSLLGGIIATACLVFVALAVLLAFAASKGIYNPIASLDLWLRGHKPARGRLDLKDRKDELGRIQQELDDKIAKLKTYFLYRLTCGGLANIDEIYNQANFLDIPVDQTYVVTLIELDKAEVAPPGDRLTVRPHLLDLVQSTLAEAVSLVNVACEYRDDSERIVAVVVFEAGRPEEAVRPVLAEACRQVQARIYQSHHATATVAVGTLQQGLENLPHSYSDANEVLKHKFIKGANAVIFSGELDGGISPDAAKYYSKNQLLNCLDAHDAGRLENLLARITANMKGKISARPVYIFYCKDIINIFLEYLGGLGSRYNDEKAEFKDMFRNFEKKYDNIDAAVQAIAACAVRVIRKLAQENPEDARRRAAEKAVAIIESEYSKDISLSYVCGKIGISEPYCSKIFKEEHGKNFKDYLTSFRLAKAKDLLRDTDDTVGAIAAAVGYNNTNQFAKMFKKYEGVTPGAFREAARARSRVVSMRQYQKNRGR